MAPGSQRTQGWSRPLSQPRRVPRPPPGPAPAELPDADGIARRGVQHGARGAEGDLVDLVLPLRTGDGAGGCGRTGVTRNHLARGPAARKAANQTSLSRPGPPSPRKPDRWRGQCFSLLVRWTTPPSLPRVLPELPLGATETESGHRVRTRGLWTSLDVCGPQLPPP